MPRPNFLRQGSELPEYYKLRRPSSHYDATAQAASSRPASRQQECASPPVFDYSAFARAKAFQEVMSNNSNSEIMKNVECNENESEMKDCDEKELKGIQRPESMVIPIGGVWRPEDEPIEDFFLDDDSNFKDF